MTWSFTGRLSSWMQLSILQLFTTLNNNCWSLTVTSLRMESFNSFKYRRLILFRQPHRKKLRNDKSGGLESYCTSPKRKMRQPGNMFWRSLIHASWGTILLKIYITRVNVKISTAPLWHLWLKWLPMEGESCLVPFILKSSSCIASRSI